MLIACIHTLNLFFPVGVFQGRACYGGFRGREWGVTRVFSVIFFLNDEKAKFIGFGRLGDNWYF